MKNKNRGSIFRIVLVLACVGLLTVAGVLAYMTDNESHLNSVRLSPVTAEVVETFTPPSKPSDDNPTMTYQKKVSVKNTGGADAYMRVSVNFSDSAIEGMTSLSSDGTNWYTAADFKNHLPADWVYVNDPNLGGAYYYYTKPIAAGASTPQLLSNVRTTYTNGVKPYDIYVYAEAVQVYDNNGRKLTGANAAVNTWRSLIEEGNTHA